MNNKWAIKNRSPLSKREADYAIHAAEGWSDKQTARLWGTGVQNVHQAAQGARDKFHVLNRTALIAQLIRQGILTPLLILLAILAPFISTSAKANDDSSDNDLTRQLRARSRKPGTRRRKDDTLDCFDGDNLNYWLNKPEQTPC